MKRTSTLLVALAIILGLIGQTSPLTPVRAQNEAQQQERGRGKILASYREEPAANNQNLAQSTRQRPDWVQEALTRSVAFLETSAVKTANAKQRAAQTNFALLSAEQDDLGLTHLRLKQLQDGVPVFGTQIITHLDAKEVVVVTGRRFETTTAKTKAAIEPEQAVIAAKIALNYAGEFAREPQAELVLLPNEFFGEDGDTGLTLTYRVELMIEDGTANTARHQYFINAQDGSVVWNFNSLEQGTGRGLYSNPVTINTDLVSTFPLPRYEMRDNARGGMFTTDLNNATSGAGTIFSSNLIDLWGDGTRTNDQSAAVDAHFGAALTWDYYLSRFGRRGIDGSGFRMRSRVHYGSNYCNAFWNGVEMTYGDCNNSPRNAFVTLDIVGHEITHGLTEKTADLVYAKQSGALNESFSDIFGTMIEYYSGRTPDYLLGEDTGSAFRSMANPTAYGHPDHYNNRNYKTGCTPNSNLNDNCGVHSNSGIQNNAFYLLAQGGTNTTSGISVTGIGRAKAEQIFYRALTVYLGPNAKFFDARLGTLLAARDLYGASSVEHAAVAKAWEAVGVKFVVYGAIYAKWISLGAEEGLLGNPLTDELGTPDGIGRFNHFEGGSIYWTPSTNAHEVHGAIRDKWASLGWERSFLGYPLTDETTTPDGVGRYNHFQGGSVYWTPSTGAHEVHGAIRNKWAALGWERGPMGYPVSDEIVTADGTGRVSFFQNGAIFWHPALGAYAIYGAIGAKYRSINYERSNYGYPLTDELGTPDGVGRYNHFQGGSIYWTPSTGAHLVYGAIRDKWASLGWERSVLGYPTSDELPTADGRGRFNYFQRGRIFWYPNTGAYVVLN